MRNPSVFDSFDLPTSEEGNTMTHITQDKAVEITTNNGVCASVCCGTKVKYATGCRLRFKVGTIFDISIDYGFDEDQDYGLFVCPDGDKYSEVIRPRHILEILA
jgi:hypothetical protein